MSGTGNAVSDVTLTGVPRTHANGLNAAVVTITNSTGATASYAVKVDFVDPAGQVVDSSIVGAEQLAAGATTQPLVYTEKDSGQTLTARLAQAQRY
ncbi:hypothetical protein [Kitasatospora nipponensis]|uniref:hypothetical protein n=1 Tax=Kitasatospora nipponensis TaxID=258049 RepID=UPI0031D2886A